MKTSGGNGAILTSALKDLLTHWEHAGSSWRDRARADFEKDCLEDLAPAVRTASNAVQQIEELLRQVLKECG